MALTSEHLQLLGNFLIFMSILGGVIGVVFGNELKNHNPYLIRLINVVTDVKIHKG